MPTKHKQLVCLNGHQIKDAMELSDSESGFCNKCGQPLISSCPKCGHYIPGTTDYEGVISFFQEPVPKYCSNCGAPYPWTESVLKSATELIELTDLSQQDKDSFSKTIPDLVTDTPKTKVAIAKFKIFSAKAGKTVASGLKDLLVDVASEAVKKAIWGN
ncbi:DUF2321 domain-containing protein [Furfurilactobacillus rossiae]|uniref:Uncharacterized protein n=1 Tax=Furfurilactobacillus rossiae DSM 15814 TaxID=1114972 RepID=A0A0R1RJ08_9LACO|nr:DUF2321 domain-containing protein [Furfurilactobacillus rossiae]KRL56636.1 hypothetical protein FD35_GL001732 [Furfurilactobacillus rossiae DSM 15814]QFR66462.1 DUF2321 domain-containing protein [Furfurilactobacillus rossiae]QLE61922.1 hypothetical protein LROSRS0_1877 [Furfurilactobacillus rossiae]